MGVHTGDSIVVAPSQTLTDKEYQMLRSAALKIIRALGIEGGCNIQFGLAPRPDVVPWAWPDGVEATPGDRFELPPYYVIEVNPRVSRSSALASKATGYPIARVAAKIAVGRTLDQIPNAVTRRTTAAFEPALDYCVVKIPRWPFDKFPVGDRQINTQMKATGEVMAIDRSFEAALQKAVRSLEIGGRSLLWEDPNWSEDPASRPLEATDERLWSVLAALRHGADLFDVARRTGVDPWFLERMQNLVRMEKRLLSEPLTRDLLRAAKRLGFSDVQVSTLADMLPEQVRDLRKDWDLRPVYKMVDTCAAEFDAVTPYFYSTYEEENEAPALEGEKVLVIGSGPIRIGQGIEFDYASVHAAWALQEAGYKALIANSNPETVSTDFDTSDRLYFEALDEESVRDIMHNEEIDNVGPGAIVQFGGQTAINLAEPLYRTARQIVGSSYDSIDLAEDRRRFERFLNRIGVPQPPGAGIRSVEEALATAQEIGYPVLVRPSYVLGGRAMEIVQNATELLRYLSAALELSEGKPVLIDKYLEGKEVEVDAICDGEEVLIPGIMEHIERAGVHSGDSMAVYPTQNLTQREIDMIVDYTTRIGMEMGVRGLMNIQYDVLSRDGGESEVYVLEVNPRASRTVPFLSKVTGVPMVRLAVNCALGTPLRQQGYSGGLWPSQPLVAVKAPVFSMNKLIGVDTYLGPGDEVDRRSHGYRPYSACRARQGADGLRSRLAAPGWRLAFDLRPHEARRHPGDPPPPRGRLSPLGHRRYGPGVGGVECAGAAGAEAPRRGPPERPGHHLFGRHPLRDQHAGGRSRHPAGWLSDPPCRHGAPHPLLHQHRHRPCRRRRAPRRLAGLRGASHRGVPPGVTEHPSRQPVTVGLILAPHGIRGELKVRPLTDFPERFEAGSRLWLNGEERMVERGRWAGRSVILKLQGLDTRNEAEALRGGELTIPEVAELEEEGVYYLHDIIGLSVVDAAGEPLGKLEEVFSTGSNDVYVVRGEQGELLLPALDDVITLVDIAGGRIVVDVPEGIEFQRRSSK